MPIHQQRELCQLSVAAVKCMGFTVGVFHVECKYTSTNGPQLIEVLRTANLLLAFCQEHSVDIPGDGKLDKCISVEICNEVEQIKAGADFEHPVEDLCMRASHVCVMT